MVLFELRTLNSPAHVSLSSELYGVTKRAGNGKTMPLWFGDSSLPCHGQQPVLILLCFKCFPLVTREHPMQMHLTWNQVGLWIRRGLRCTLAAAGAHTAKRLKKIYLCQCIICLSWRGPEPLDRVQFESQVRRQFKN